LSSAKLDELTLFYSLVLFCQHVTNYIGTGKEKIFPK